MISCLGIYIYALLMQHFTEARSQEELYKHTVKRLSTRRKGEENVMTKNNSTFVTLRITCVMPDNSVSYHLHRRYSIYYLDNTREWMANLVQTINCFDIAICLCCQMN